MDRSAMSWWWSSVRAALGGGGGAVLWDPDEEGTAALLRRRLFLGKAAAASDREAVENLEEEMRALERAVATATSEREAAEAWKREVEMRAGEIADELKTLEEDHHGHVEELLRMGAERDAMVARIRELEDRIKIKCNLAV